MDKHNLVVLFLGKLNKQCSSSSEETPSAISRKNKSPLAGTIAKKHHKSDPIQQQLVDNVAGLHKSVASVASSSIRGQINNYQQELFKMQEKKFTTPGITQDYIDLIDTRINEIKHSISALQENLEGVDSQPRVLNYERRANS